MASNDATSAELEQSSKGPSFKIPDVPYAEDTPLNRVFGGKKDRVITALLSERDQALDLHDTARIAGISPKETLECLEELRNLGIVVELGDKPDGRQFRINTDGGIGDLIFTFEESLVDHFFGT